MLVSGRVMIFWHWWVTQRWSNKWLHLGAHSQNICCCNSRILWRYYARIVYNHSRFRLVWVEIMMAMESEWSLSCLCWLWKITYIDFCYWHTNQISSVECCTPHFTACLVSYIVPLEWLSSVALTGQTLLFQWIFLYRFTWLFYDKHLWLCISVILPIPSCLLLKWNVISRLWEPYPVWCRDCRCG